MRENLLLTIIVMTGVFMAILDTTIVDIVVPRMMAPLSTDLYGVQWVVTSYMTAAATGIMLVEWLESYLGLKKVFLLGLVLFTSSSAYAGNSGSLAEMILARILQGFGEALIVVSAEAMLFTSYPPEKRGLAMGIYGLGVSFAPALGPTLGGWITEHLSWRWVFYINVPIGILNTFMATFFLREFPKTRHTRMNWFSFLFLSMGTVNLLVVLSKGQQMGWFSSDTIGYLTLLSILGFLLFLLWEIISHHKLVDPALFKIKEFLVSLLVYFLLLGFSMYQVFYILPLYFENLKGISTFHTGLHILPLALSIGISSPIAGAISDRKSDRLPLYVAVSLYLFSSFFLLPQLDLFTPTWKASLYLILLGIGMGFFFAPVTNLALKKLGDKVTVGVSLMHYVRFVGGSFGTAIATNDLQRFMWENFQRTTEIQNHQLVGHFLEELSGYFWLPQEKAQAFLYQVQSLYSYSDAFKETFLMAGVWGLLGSLPILYLLLDHIFTKVRLYRGRVPPAD
ncbi:drug resistance transporter, EmrB/QacA subfamily [Thermocrinis albus DSM 14484]|uniref:Drug resistance transporter, EmrB/QacA subfamily n=1 Tax=Thermocrinis albus (strain DSM 14484 / JCM 11386 / HI 11/12) TaxID=638303 RepID=D3SNK0_THEAH|nr:DHA2 family efflux MFS transporter permease subunit [Thermocrinis albus]ADC88737.1 drug resistance transporter, EmrB/QacA subfamily [Thermocrinis albus DSM 14484]